MKRIIDKLKILRLPIMFVGLLAFIVSWVMLYQPLEDNSLVYFSAMKNITIWLLIISGLPFRIKDNRLAIGFIVFLLGYSMVLIATGIYNVEVTQVKEYLTDVVLYSLLALSISSVFKSKIEWFLFAWQIGLTGTLFYLAMNFNDELNINFFDLFIGMFGNERLSRVGIGFYNVNILGGLAGVLIMVSFFLIIMKKMRQTSFVTMMFGFFLLFNAGTRSALLGTLLSLVLAMVLFLGKSHSQLIWKGFVGLVTLGQGFYLGFLFFVQKGSGVYTLASDLTTTRSSLGVEAVEKLISLRKLWFGTGMRSQSEIRENFFKSWVSTNGLDSDIQWFLFTVGVVGVIALIVFLILGMHRLSFNSSIIWKLGLAYFVAFSTFEHALLYFEGVSGASGIFWTFFITLAFSAQSERLAFTNRRGDNETG